MKRKILITSLVLFILLFLFFFRGILLLFIPPFSVGNFHYFVYDPGDIFIPEGKAVNFQRCAGKLYRPGFPSTGQPENAICIGNLSEDQLNNNFTQPNKTTPSTSWLTYENPELGIRISYPPIGTEPTLDPYPIVTRGSGGMGYLISFINDAAGTGTSMQDPVLIIQQFFSVQDFNKFSAEYFGECEPKATCTQTVVDGAKGVISDVPEIIPGTGVTRNVFFAKGNTIYQLSGSLSKHEGVLEAMLPSFRFTK